VWCEPADLGTRPSEPRASSHAQRCALIAGLQFRVSAIERKAAREQAREEIVAKHAARLARRAELRAREDPAKAKAHAAVTKAIREGRLVRPPACEECGATGRIEGHHPDYALPLVVEWLCSTCHHTRHPRVLKERKRKPLQPKGGHPGFGNPLNLLRRSKR
jgi:hypothetical protein